MMMLKRKSGINEPRRNLSFHPLLRDPIHRLNDQIGFTAASPAFPNAGPEEAGAMRLVKLCAYSEHIEIKGVYRLRLQGFIPQPEVGVQDAG